VQVRDKVSLPRKTYRKLSLYVICPVAPFTIYVPLPLADLHLFETSKSNICENIAYISWDGQCSQQTICEGRQTCSVWNKGFAKPKQVVRVICCKGESPPHMDGSISYSPAYASFGYPSHHAKRHLDRFSHFGRDCDRPTDRPTYHATRL